MTNLIKEFEYKTIENFEKCSVHNLENIFEKQKDEMKKFFEENGRAKESQVDYSYFLEQFLNDKEHENKTIKNFEEYLIDNDAFEIEISYCSTALEYLMKHDNSLTKSLELAAEQEYETDEINSKLLASLLASEKEIQNFVLIKSEFNNQQK